jgi:hypothetical protein
MKVPTDEATKEVAEWLDLKLSTGKVSRLLIGQLADGMINRTLHVHNIYDEIGALEGAPYSRSTNTKPPAEFTGVQLRGLWHKHYSDASHILKNIGLHWGKDFDRFGKFLKNGVLAGRDSVELTPEVLRRISHTFVIDAFKDRNAAKKMTGEWIIFAVHDSRNYYLTLGTHDEGDDAVAARVRQCAMEFPELQLPI